MDHYLENINILEWPNPRENESKMEGKGPKSTQMEI